VYLRVPKLILPIFDSFYKYNIWHHVLKLKKKSFFASGGLQVVFEGTCSVREGDVRLVR
jgi:hypothetical protein